MSMQSRLIWPLRRGNRCRYDPACLIRSRATCRWPPSAHSLLHCRREHVKVFGQRNALQSHEQGERSGVSESFSNQAYMSFICALCSVVGTLQILLSSQVHRAKSRIRTSVRLHGALLTRQPSDRLRYVPSSPVRWAGRSEGRSINARYSVSG